jgi:hypothetical protein
MILQAKRDGNTGPFNNRTAKLLRKLADEFGSPATFALDACRRMTELEKAELTTGQGKALFGHRTDRAYGGYANRRVLAATRKRHADRLTNESSTKFRNEAPQSFRRGEITVLLLLNPLRVFSNARDGGVSRAAKGADCKSAGLAFVGSSPTSPTRNTKPNFIRYLRQGPTENHWPP